MYVITIHKRYRQTDRQMTFSQQYHTTHVGLCVLRAVKWNHSLERETAYRSYREPNAFSTKIGLFQQKINLTRCTVVLRVFIVSCFLHDLAAYSPQRAVNLILQRQICVRS